LKKDGIQISLLDVACLTLCKMWLQENVAKWLPIVFGSKIYLCMRKYNIFYIVFNFDFVDEMNFFVPLCVMKENVLEKDMKQKSCKVFTLL
jgi:hypothetical protein